MAQNGKGSKRVKSSDHKKYSNNLKMKEMFEPQWKKDLRKIRGDKNE